MQIVPNGDSLHEMPKPVFWKKWETYFSISYAENSNQFYTPRYTCMYVYNLSSLVIRQGRENITCTTCIPTSSIQHVSLVCNNLSPHTCAPSKDCLKTDCVNTHVQFNQSSLSTHWVTKDQDIFAQADIEDLSNSIDTQADHEFSLG